MNKHLEEAQRVEKLVFPTVEPLDSTNESKTRQARKSSISDELKRMQQQLAIIEREIDLANANAA